MKSVVVTGGIGSGKSAVCALLRERGIPVYDCDAHTKDLYQRRPSLVKRLEKALGSPLRQPDGCLDKGRLAALIFSDDSARERLEAIVYPLVLQDYRRWQQRFPDAPYCVLESAVILSKPVFDGVADAVVLVEAPEALRIQRVQARDGLSREEILRRMAAQDIPVEKADVVLRNDGDKSALSAAVEQVFFDKNAYLCKILEQEKNQIQ